MNENELCAKLIAAARSNPPSDHVPYAFEKRIMSRLTAGASGAANDWDLWGRQLWRAASSCVGVTVVLCGVWSLTTQVKAQNTENFSQDFEDALFAPPAQHFEDAW